MHSVELSPEPSVPSPSASRPSVDDAVTQPSGGVAASLALGAVAGLAGGLLVFAIEATDRVVALWPSFNSSAEPALFALYLAPSILLGLAAGLVVVPALGALGALVGAVERRLHARFGRGAALGSLVLLATTATMIAGVGIELARRAAGLRSLAKLGTIASLYFMDANAPLLSKAALVAGKWIWPLLLGGAFAAALVLAAAPRLLRRESATGRYAGAAIIAAAVALLYWFDSRFEYARYDSLIHLPAAAAQCVLAAFAAALATGWRIGRGARRVAAVAAAFGVLASAFAVAHIGSNENLKTLLWRRSVVARRAYALAVAAADRDGDGFASLLAGGDPDDRDAAINPLATDQPMNGIDENGTGGDAPARPDIVPAAAPAARGRRFVFIAIDTLRADRMSLYGYHRPTTPRIDEHARSGLVFERCYSQGTNTAVAFAAMQTSATRGGVFEPWRERLFPRLDEAGFRTAQVNAVIESDWLKAKSSSRPYREVILDGIDEFPHETGKQFWDGDEVTDAAIEYLSSLPAGQPSATWVHYFDPHTPRRKMAPFDFGDSASDKYDSEVVFSDREVGRLLDWMRTSGFMDDAIVILTADHGEAFLEHGMDFHGNRPYSEQVHIPMVVWAPSLEPGRSPAPASIIDVAPTVLELLGLRPMLMAEGRSLLGPIEPDRPIFSETPLNIVDGPFFAFAVTQGRWRLIHDVVGNTTELYDLEADPRELHNLADEEPERVAALRGVLARWLDETRSVPSAEDAMWLLGQ